MFTNEKNTKKLFISWLNISLFLVFFIIIIGGLTRLTNSGLSITEWELFKGILPPIDKKSWNLYFDLYKEIPQYKLLNYNMTLEEFKIIFYWEYFHRILARLIGLFILLPLIYFYFSKKINSNQIRVCFIILILIVLQGIVGWYMVKSGLVNDITVSHYRLSIHLTTALIIISIIFWLLKNLKSDQNKIFFKYSLNTLPFQILILLIFIQVIIGAFVSGLDAGKIYQSWPMMGTTYFPNDIIFSNINQLFDFDSHSLVQFYHRNLAYVIILYSLCLGVYVYGNKKINLFKPIKILFFFILLQSVLGIFTLISGLNIFLASIHQITSVLLVLSALNLYYFEAK